MQATLLINLTYIAAAVLFILGLKMLSSPVTARRGNRLSALGMLLAITATLFSQGMTYQWIITGLVLGAVIGTLAARLVAMTAMPEMVALLNGFGGLASLLVGWAKYHTLTPAESSSVFMTATIYLAVLIGGVTFSGSMVAWGKLSTWLSGKPVMFRGQQLFNGLLMIAIVVLGVLFCRQPTEGAVIFGGGIALALLLGIMSVIAIGGADMPVVISLLNSYSGLAACTAGFVIQNNMLIVAGALVGASGLILTAIMCKAMNRSLTNVLFSGFGAVRAQKQDDGEKQVKSITPADAYYILEAARFVVIVPGYGLAVAQAQHALHELGTLLEENGAEICYAIHPVAGRMPGHMNVLLAEENVPYEQLVEMEEINPRLPTADVCLVIGANDVVNPAAREDANSPIYGMPIIDADRARTVIVLKRSLSPGFAGIDNPLFYRANTCMLFGNAKDTVQALVTEFKTQ